MDPPIVPTVSSNEVRLQLSVLAYNLGNLWRRLALAQRIKNWSLMSSQQRLVKTRGRLIKHTRYYWLLLAEGGASEQCLRNRLRGSERGSSNVQKRSIGTPLILPGSAVVANSLSPR